MQIKRAIVLLLALCFVLAGGACAGEAQERFDFTVFEGLDGYQYDKFEDTWSFFGAYLEEYSDARVIIGIQVSGNDEGISFAPYLYTRITGPTSSEPLYTVKAIDLIIDDTKYSYKKMLEGKSDSSVLLGNEGKQLVEALADCESIAVKLTLEYNSITIDLDQKEVEKTLKAVCSELLKYDVWSYIDEETVALLEGVYPLTIK